MYNVHELQIIYSLKSFDTFKSFLDKTGKQLYLTKCVKTSLCNFYISLYKSWFLAGSIFVGILMIYEDNFFFCENYNLTILRK